MVIYDITTNGWYTRRYIKLRIGKPLMFVARLGNTKQKHLLYCTPLEKNGEGWVVITHTAQQLVNKYMEAINRKEVHHDKS